MIRRRSRASDEAGKALEEARRDQFYDASGHTCASSLDGAEGPPRDRRRGCLAVRTQRESLNGAPRLGSPPPRRGDAVRFGEVEVRSYPLVLCDNPSTSSGPPVGIGWRHDPARTVRSGVDELEARREAAGSRRGAGAEELKIPSSERERMLVGAGYSRHEIRSAAEKARRDKLRRKESTRLLERYGGMLEKMETVESFLKRGVKSWR